MRVVLWTATVLCALPALAGRDEPSRSYDFVWGGLDNIAAGATLTESLTSLAFDDLSLGLQGSRFDNVGTRSLNLVLVQTYLGALVYGSLAHELFGHFSLALQDGLHPRLALDFPAFGGSVQFDTSYLTPALTRQEVAAAGPDVTETVAYLSTRSMYSGHPVGSYTGLELVGGHLIDSYVYYWSSLDPFLRDPAHSLVVNANPRGPVPNDPVAWALALTERYGFYEGAIPPSATWVTVPRNSSAYLNPFILDQGRRVKRAYTLQLFDPSFLNGLYGIARYLVTGEPFFRPILIGSAHFAFAPSIRADLGYLGAENYFDLFVVSDVLPPFSAYFRTGGNLLDTVHGIGVEVREVRLGDRVELDAQLDGWIHAGNRVGGNFEERVVVRLSRHWSLVEALGYKSLGSLMGKPTGAGPYGELGMRLSLPGS